MTTRNTVSKHKRTDSPDPADSDNGSCESQRSSRKRSRSNSDTSSRDYNVNSDYDDEPHNNDSSMIDLCKLEDDQQREMEKVYHKFGQVIKKTAIGTTPYIKKAFAVSSIYLFWILLHFITAQMYVRYCAHPSLYGLLISPFLISAPHCAAMRWVFTKGGTLIDGMWILLGTWLCSKVIYRDV